MSDDHKEFSPEKIFLWLFIFTALEVAWGYLGDWAEWGRGLLWGGLLFYAFLKAWLIASYFMHLRFEGWVVKGLIAPTPVLVLVILAALNPDVGNNDKMDHPVGSLLNDDEGVVTSTMHFREYDLVKDEESEPESGEDAGGEEAGAEDTAQ